MVGMLKKGTNMQRQGQRPSLESLDGLYIMIRSHFLFSSFKALKPKSSLVTKRKLK